MWVGGTGRDRGGASAGAGPLTNKLCRKARGRTWGSSSHFVTSCCLSREYCTTHHADVPVARPGFPLVVGAVGVGARARPQLGGKAAHHGADMEEGDAGQLPSGTGRVKQC
eukprot:6035213-Prymnesium_polylepis.1